MSRMNKQLSAVEEQLSLLGMKQMSESLDEIYHSADFIEKDCLTIISRIVSDEFQIRADRRLNNHLKEAHLTGAPQEIDKCVDSDEREYLPKDITSTLSSLEFINDGLNVCILGPSDSGKSYLARALGIEACADHKVGYEHCAPFLEEMTALKKSDFVKYQKKMRRCLRKELFIIDDFLLHMISDEDELKILYELLEERSVLSRSTVVCSQREPTSWKAMMLNDEVAADAIVKRATKHYTVVINPKSE